MAFVKKNILSFFVIRIRAYILINCLLLSISNTYSITNPIAVNNDTIKQTSGIIFYTGSWNDILSEAKRQKKPIFLDMYTTWCAPCKLMAKEAFSNPHVGEIFNERFISYQLDAEKGEGLRIAKLFSVDAFPTLLYINSDGSLLHRSVGYININELLKEADKVSAKIHDTNTLPSLERQFNAGNKDVAFLKKYLQELSINKRANSEALDLYLKLTPTENWVLKENLEIIINHTTDFNSLAYKFLLKQTPLLIKSNDKEVRDLGLGARIQQFQVINSTLEKAINTQNEELLEECISQELKIYSTMINQVPKDQHRFSNEKKLYFYERTRQIEKYKPIALLEAKYLLSLSIDSIKAKDIESYKLFLQNTATISDSKRQSQGFKKQAERMQHIESGRIANKLNNIAKVFYDNTADSSDLSQALTWSMKSLAYHESVPYVETAALLLNKLGRKPEAISLLNQAIFLEKEKDQDTTRLVTILTGLSK